MPLDINDPATWTTSVLNTPSGAIKYWVLADWEAFYEQFEADANLTRVLIAVDWKDASLFKWYALGFAERAGPNDTFLRRYVPLRCPWQDNQYCTSLKKHAVHAGTDAAGAPQWHEPDFLTGNWPTFPDTLGVVPRIVYDATFTCPNWDVIDQNEFVAKNYKESKRYVTRQEQMNPRERKVPGAGYETAVGAVGTGTPIPEVGFVPWVDWEFVLVWNRVPVNLVPNTAIRQCMLRINQFVFDYIPDNTDPRLVGDAYGRFSVGDILFKGLAHKTAPYRGPNGEWLRDLPYTFAYQPADGTGNGHNKVPRNDGTWIAIRDRVSGAPLYASADLDGLFKPAP